MAGHRIQIGQRSRFDGRIGRDGRLQQVGMEGQQKLPRSGGAFGENGQDVALTQAVCHAVNHPHRISAAFSLDEQCARRADEFAQKRPVPDARLGHKMGRTHSIDDQDVQPRNVVGHHQQRAILGDRAHHVQLDPHDPQHLT